MIQGIGAAAGVAIGKAFVLPNWEWSLPDTQVNPVDLAKEFERLYEGIRTSKDEIEFIKKSSEKWWVRRNRVFLMLIWRS